jgi:hypothetical protein
VWHIFGWYVCGALIRFGGRGLVHTSATAAKAAGHNGTNDSNGPAVVPSDNDADEYNTAAASGQLTGMAQDQDTLMVPVDEEARRTAATANDSASGDMYQALRPGASRQLRDIVRESTERWLMASDGGEDEFLREMQAMGYRNELVAEEIRQAQNDERGREYHGMLRLGCKRVIVTAPQRVRGFVDQLKIVSVSAGYAHCMILTQNGQLYAAGYNDRGQLGLG